MDGKYMDVVSLYASGIKNVISNSGTALTEKQINTIYYGILLYNYCILLYIMVYYCILWYIMVYYDILWYIMVF